MSNYISNLVSFMAKGFTNHSVKDFYDSSAENYDIVMRKQDDHVRVITGYMPECETALDIAMGTGITSKYMRERCRTLVSLDFSEGMIEEGRKKLGLEAKIVKANFLNIPLKDKSIDVSVCTAALSHIPRNSYNNFFSEVGRVTKKYFITEARVFTLSEKIYGNLYGSFMKLLGHHEQLLNFDKERLQDALSKNGFVTYVIPFGSHKNSYIMVAKKTKSLKCECPGR